MFTFLRRRDRAFTASRCSTARYCCSSATCGRGSSSATSRDIISALQGVVAIRYDTTEAFNVDSKAECGRLNLAQ